MQKQKKIHGAGNKTCSENRDERDQVFIMIKQGVRIENTLFSEIFCSSSITPIIGQSMLIAQLYYSLSCREESWKNKLFACLLACTSTGSKNHFFKNIRISILVMSYRLVVVRGRGSAPPPPVKRTLPGSKKHFF